MPERVARHTGFLVWFGLLGGMIAWALQLWFGWGIEEVACPVGTKTNEIFGADPDPVVLIFSIAAAGVAAAAALSAAVGLRAATPESDPRGRIAFMGIVGLAADLLFLWLILLGVFQLLGARACAPG